MIELGLHVALRIAESKRLGLGRVRLEMLPMVLAEHLLEIIQKEIGRGQA